MQHTKPTHSAEIINFLAIKYERDLQKAAARNAAHQQQQPQPKRGTPIMRRRIEW